jgi:hypothetical protein
MSLYNGSVTIKGGSTHNAAKTTPEVLGAECGTINVSEPPIWEFVPRSSVINLALARVSFFEYVRCEPVRRGNGGPRRSDDQLRIGRCRWFGRSNGLLYLLMNLGACNALSQTLTAISLLCILAWPGVHFKISKMLCTLFSRLRVQKWKPRSPPSSTRRRIMLTASDMP